jgi:hypothetical protein
MLYPRSRVLIFHATLSIKDYSFGRYALKAIDMKSMFALLVTAVLLVSVSSIITVHAQATQVSSTITLKSVNLQVAYPSEVVPGNTVTVQVQVNPVSGGGYLENLTATVYYADATGLHQIASQNLVANQANTYSYPAPYQTVSYSKTMQFSVPQNAPRTSLVAVFSETFQSQYYYDYHCFVDVFYSYCPSYSDGNANDEAIAALSYIKAPTPEYVSLQSTYQLLQQQLNQTQTQLKQSQTQNQQLQNAVSQESVTINQLNQQLASANQTTQNYQALAAALGIVVVILVIFTAYQSTRKEKRQKTLTT